MTKTHLKMRVIIQVCHLFSKCSHSTPNMTRLLYALRFMMRLIQWHGIVYGMYAAISMMVLINWERTLWRL